MTQIDPNIPYTEQKPEYREEFHVMGEQLGTTVEQLLHEGNVRRIIIKHEGHTMLEIPLTVGVVGVVVAPLLAAVGAIGAAVPTAPLKSYVQSHQNKWVALFRKGQARHLSQSLAANRTRFRTAG
jgi:hypothetical protein